MNALKTAVVIAALLALAWIAMTCKESSTDAGKSDIVFPDSNVSYGKHVGPLFLQACAYPGCHSDDTFDAMGFSLDAYERATARPGIIIACQPKQPCNPEASILVRRIEGLDGKNRMPLFQTPLNDNQIKGIKTWIREGAQNN